MGRVNIKLEIAKEAAEIKLKDMTGTLTIEASVKEAQRQAQRNLNRLHGLHEIIKAVRGEDDSN